MFGRLSYIYGAENASKQRRAQAIGLDCVTDDNSTVREHKKPKLVR